MDRRVFLKSVGGCGLASLAAPAAILAHNLPAQSYFRLHPFIEAHPEAVFIRLTQVGSKNDAEGKKREALALARQIFTATDKPGIPLTHKFAIKPNLTSAKNSGLTHAIVTDPYVVEGLVEGMKLTGVPAGNVFVREGLSPQQNGVGFVELSGRAGIHYGDNDSREPTTKECSDGVVFRRTKYAGPFNYPDSWLLNVSKLKSHSMGLTLCVKNLQGTNMQPYIRFCGGIQKAIAQDFQPDAESHVDDLYEKHRHEGFARWDTEKGSWMEMWAQRTIDSYTQIRASVGLNVIEGVYSQNGDGFDGGPSSEGIPESFLSNVLIFGKDAFRVDIIGHWIGGHEPGNFGLFHIARERGVSTALNPRNIPVYIWQDSGPVLTPLEKLQRTPLTTPYLTRTGETRFHLVNEPFTYAPEQAAACLAGEDAPGLQVLGKSGSSMVFEYNLPSDQRALLDLYNARGDRIGILAEGLNRRGIHAASWNTERLPAGLYGCRLRTGTADVVRFVTLA